MKILWSGCDKKLKSGTQCDTCGRWYRNSCGNVKGLVAESGRWSCERCRSERLRVLAEKLRFTNSNRRAKTEKQGAGGAITNEGKGKG